MIPDIFIVIGGWILNLINFLLTPLQWTLSLDIQSAINWLFAPLKYFGYWLDLSNLGKAIVALMIFEALWWTFQIVRFAISIIRGHAGHTPKA